MSHSQAKEQRRNLKNAIGETAASAVGELRSMVKTSALEHRTLAQQMLSFETTVAAMREARAVDKRTIADLSEQVQNLRARVKVLEGDNVLGGEREARLADGLRDFRAESEQVIIDLSRRVRELEKPWRVRLREMARRKS